MNVSHGSDDADPLPCELVVERADGSMLTGQGAIRWLSTREPGRKARVLLRGERAGCQQIYMLEEEAGSGAAGGADLGLTPREEEVMFWVEMGKSNGEIAKILCISPSTVHHHLDHVYEKLHVGTRFQAVVVMRMGRRGL